MTTGTREARTTLRRGLDGLGRAELAGVGVWTGGVFALLVLEATSRMRADGAPGPVPWAAAVVAGVVACTATVLAVAREWRRHGGRQVQRLGRRTWWSGRLPEQLPLRVAVLRDLQRRERRLAQSWLPTWVVALIWAVPLLIDLDGHPDALDLITRIGIWTIVLVPGVLDFVDRRSRTRLHRLVRTLRLDPVGAAPQRTIERS